MKLKFSILLKVVISLGFIGLLLWSFRGSFSEIAQTIRGANLFVFFLAVLSFAISISLLSCRLRLILAGEGFRIPYPRVLQLSFIGYFFNNFMPTAIGGDVVKTYYVHNQTKELGKSVVAVIMDRLLGMAGLILICTFSLAVSWKTADAELKKVVFTFAACGFALFFIMLNRRVGSAVIGLLSKIKILHLREKLLKTYTMVHDYSGRVNVIFGAVGFAILAQVMYFVAVYTVSKSLHLEISMAMVFLMMPLVTIVSMLPSIGGLGLREGAIVAFFGPAVGSENAFAVGILLLAMLFIISIIGAMIYMLAPQFRIKDMKDGVL